MKDHAVEEIRARRRKLLKDKYDGSIARMIEDGMQWQAKHPDRVVDLRKRRRSSKSAAA